MHCCFMFYHLTFIVLCCSVLGLAIHCSYCIKRFSLPTAMMSKKTTLLYKTTAVSELIDDRPLDVAVLSETWHRSPGDILVRLVTPPGYTVVDAVRPSDPGHGGLAIVFRDEFIWSRITLPAVSTFECLGVRLTTDDASLVVIAVYRPGSVRRPTSQFFDDLSTLFESLVLLRCPIVIDGDYNVHVEDLFDPNRPNSLAELLESFSMTQRVPSSTHQHGSTLDVVITLDARAMDGGRIFYVGSKAEGLGAKKNRYC